MAQAMKLQAMDLQVATMAKLPVAARTGLGQGRCRQAAMASSATHTVTDKPQTSVRSVARFIRYSAP